MFTKVKMMRKPFRIFVKGELIPVRRQGVDTVLGDDGETYIYDKEDGKWYPTTLKILKSVSFVPEVPDSEPEATSVGVGGRPFVVDYGVRKNDPNAGRIHDIVRFGDSGDRYQYRLVGNWVVPVIVLRYVPPKVLSSRDPARFRSGAKGSRAKAAI